MDRIAKCHPDRPFFAREMCGPCYQADYHQRNKEVRNARKRKDPGDYAPNYRKPKHNPPAVPSCGHADRRMVARGMCGPCYQRARRSGEIVVGMATCHPNRPELAKLLCHQCYARKHYWDDPEKMQADARISQKRVRERLREQLIAAYGSKCACPKCPEANQAFLTLEHIGLTGKAHRDEVGSHAYADLRRRGFPQEGYALLCMNCNHGSRFTGVCPHMQAEE